MMKRISLLLFLFLFLQSWAQETTDNPNFSPYTLVNNFNSNLKQDNYKPEEAAKSFKKTDTADRKDLAIKLKKILDGKGVVLDFKKVPNDPEFVDSATKQHIYQLIPSEKRIYVERYDEKWYFSDETIAEIPEMYDEVYMVKIEPGKYLKGKFWDKKILNVSLASWLGLIVLLLACLLFYHLIYRGLRAILRAYSKKRLDYNSKIASYTAKMARIFALYVVCHLFVRYLPSLHFPLSWNSLLIKIVGISSIIFLVVFVCRLIDAIAYVLINRFHFSAKFNEQIIPIVQRLLKILVWVIGIFYILYYYMNVEPTALIAGLSIGGIALALAAQDTVKNFLGSAIILIDKPFEVNDWIQFGDHEGIVEEVGIRSTRIRSFEDSVIYVPNSTISTEVLNNKGLRKFRRFRTFLGVQYDTSPEEIDEFVHGLVEIIKNHPDTVKYNYNVHLYDLNDSSIDILFNCFFSVSDSDEEFKARHELLSSILKLAREKGIEFAFPSRSIYIENSDNFNPSQKS